MENEGKGKGYGKGKGKGKTKEIRTEDTNGGGNVLPPPDHDDPMGKMQNQMEISRRKCDRDIIMDVSKECFLEIVKVLVGCKTGYPASATHRIAE